MPNTMEEPRPCASGAITKRQRLALTAGTSVPLGTALDMADEDFNMAFFSAHNVRAPQIRVAKLNAVQLKSRGVTTARELRALDFRALDLVDPAFCASCVAAYGSNAIVNEFLVTASDAVTLAGTAAVHQLRLDAGSLLILCAGHRVEATSVITMSAPHGRCLAGVAADILLDCQLRAGALIAAGFTAQTVAQQTRATPDQLREMGF